MRRLLAVAVGLAVAALTHHAHADLVGRRAAFPADEDVLYLPPSGQLRVMSMGYREVLGDLVWIRAVIFAGDRIGSQNFAWILRYVDAVVHLVPTFRRPYDWAGVTAIYNGQPIDRQMVSNAIKMYRRGLEHFPEDHEFLFSLGMILFREVGPSTGFTAEERDAAREEGAVLIRKAAAFGAPPLVRQLAATLVADGSGDQLAVQFLETQLLHADDEDYRRLLRRKLEALLGATGVRELNELRERRQAQRMAEFPYVPDALYALIRSDLRDGR